MNATRTQNIEADLDIFESIDAVVDIDKNNPQHLNINLNVKEKPYRKRFDAGLDHDFGNPTLLVCTLHIIYFVFIIITIFFHFWCLINGTSTSVSIYIK